MSWRIVTVTRRCKLDLKMNYLVVRSEDEVKRIHLDEISVLMLENTAISITGCLLCELSRRKIKVIFCDAQRNPCAELVSQYGSYDCSRKIEKQIKWSNETKGLVWSEIIAEKIRKQAEHLEFWGKNDESQLLKSYTTQIEFADKTNREGHAAKVYFNALFGMDFTRTFDCAINAALNYGYSLIVSAFSREIVANGYLTQLGIFHSNMSNQFNLASDMMEPYRILVDRRVRECNFTEFESEQKHIMLDMLNTMVKIDGTNQFIINSIKIYCRSFFEAMNENDVSLLKFYSYEL